MSRLLSALLGALALGACVSADPTAIGPYPSDYKATMKKYLEESFFDPYSMRNVAISSPRQGHLYFQQGWVICLQANAKNRMGGYTGLQTSAYLINHDAVVQSMQDAPLCSEVVLSPWPEMEGNG